MDLDSVLVTGANRGIGLEFVRQLVNLPKPPRLVFATYRDRNTVKALKDIRDAYKTSQVLLIEMDITKSEEISTARKIIEDMVGEKGLTLLINNAGAAKLQAFPEATDENFLFHYTTNTLGPIKVLKEMLPLLQRSAANHLEEGMKVSRAAVLNISSTGGSITSVSSTQPPISIQALGYRMSKAALNMAMRVIAVQVKDQGVLVVQMCPGWVKTDMGTEYAQLEVSDSVSAMLATLPKLEESYHASFINHNGDHIPF